MTKWLPVVGAVALILTGCLSTATGVTPDQRQLPSSGRQLSGTVQGAKVGTTTKVAIVGGFTNAQGAKIDALGRPIQGDSATISSVPVKEGKYAMDLPAIPLTANGGEFAVRAYNDGNTNNQIDPGEDSVLATVTLRYTPFIGYNVFSSNPSQQDVLALDAVNLTFD